MNPWSLRQEALTRLLSPTELWTVLHHICKRRGYPTGPARRPLNIDTESEEKKEEQKKVLDALVDLRQKFEAWKAAHPSHLTIGQFLAKEPHQRNGSGSYSLTVPRDLLREEIQEIFRCQRSFGSTFLTAEIEHEILDRVVFFQRSPQSTAKLVGRCTFERGKKRAPAASLTAQRARLLEKINNLQLCDLHTGARIGLSADERRGLILLCEKRKKVTFKQIRRELRIPPHRIFNLVRYKQLNRRRELGSTSATESSAEESPESSQREKDPENADFFSLSSFHQFRESLSSELSERLFNDTLLADRIVRILTTERDKLRIAQILGKWGLSSTDIEELSQFSFRGFSSLSIKVLYRIIPYLEQGLRYDRACREAGYDHSAQISPPPGQKKLPPFGDEIRNPVVRRALAQARKVFNALVREYGVPASVHVEVARDLSRPRAERNEIESDNKKRADQREKAKAVLREIKGREPRPIECEKYRFWSEQGGICLYSGRAISIPDLFDHGLLEIDHAIPWSRSFDDSWRNRVLVYSEENQRKGNRTPYEYLGFDTERWEHFCAHVSRLGKLKAAHLTRQSFTEEDEEEWRARNLQDTRWISREFYNHIARSIDFGGEEGKRRVFTRSGQFTAALRRFWGLSKSREDDLHHALDAICVACSTESQVKALSDFSRRRELQQSDDSGNRRARFPLPWESFRDEVLEAVSKVFVSRAPNRKGGGAAHEDTVRSLRYDENGNAVIVQHVSLEKLSLKMLEDLWDRRRNHRLYEALEHRLKEYDGNAKRAFAQPFYMPTKTPEKPGPQVHRVLIRTSEKSGVPLSRRGGGIASNGRMVRVDVFEKHEKELEFYLVPVYAHQLKWEQLPARAIVANKSEEEWPQIDESYRFRFSLAPGDYVKVITSEGKPLEGYYVKTDRGNGRITIHCHCSRVDEIRIGTRTLKSFEKCSVNVIGTCLTPIKSETRIQPHSASHVARRPRRKSRAAELPGQPAESGAG